MEKSVLSTTGWLLSEVQISMNDPNEETGTQNWQLSYVTQTLSIGRFAMHFWGNEMRSTLMLEFIYSTMAGKPFKVGRFAHTLRVRLMREHLGIDVDALDEEDLMANEPVKEVYDQETWDPDREQAFGKESGVTHVKKSNQKTPLGDLVSAGTDALNQGKEIS